MITIYTKDNLLTLAGHEVVIGRTQSGKTHYTIHGRAKHWPGPVLFFNPQGFPAGDSWIDADGYSDLSLIKRALMLKKHIAYIPSDNDAIAVQELNQLVDLSFSGSWPSAGLLFIADEAQDFAGPLRRIARRGLARGVTGVFISQRPAEMHNTLLTQAIRHVIFASAWESQYFKRYGLDADFIQQTLATAKPYSYAVLEQGKISGPFSI